MLHELTAFFIGGWSAAFGRKQTIRKVSPVQIKRGAEQYERELRRQLVTGQ